MPGDHDGFPALDLVDQLGKLGFRRRELNLLHIILTGHFD